MEKLLFYLLVLVVVILPYTTVNGATPPNSMDFIKASCKTTLHPTLCVNCLSSYSGSIQGSDHQLAKAAITVSFKNAKSAFCYKCKPVSSGAGEDGSDLRGFADHSLNEHVITKRIEYISQVTSNALALVNRLTDEFFNHLKFELGQLRFVVQKTEGMEERVIELEAQQLEGIR
ncbi:pectinesterase inhibitor 9-like protein [Tanacetum coccineum]